MARKLYASPGLDVEFKGPQGELLEYERLNEPYNLPQQLTNKPVEQPAQQQAQLPAKLDPNRRLRDIRNDKMGQAAIASIGGGAGALTAAGAMATLGSAIPALAPFLTNPVTAGVGLALGGLLAAAPSIYNKFDQISNNNKMNHAEKRILELQKLNQNDPQVQQELLKQRQDLANFAQKMQNLAPQSPETLQYINQLTNGIGANIDQSGNKIGEPGTIMNSNGSSVQRLPIYNEAQLGLQNQYLQELSRPQRGFEPIARQEIKRLHQETLPQIAEQYFGRNPQSFGSSYPEALGRGASGLAERLTAMQSKFESDREGRLQDIAFRPNFDSIYQPRQPGMWENIAVAAAPGLLKAGGELANSGLQYLGKSFGSSQQASKVQPQQQTNYMPEPLSNLNPRRPSANVVAQGDNALQQVLMNAAEQKNYRLGGRSK